MRSPSKVGVLLLNLLAAALVVYSLSLVFLSNFNMGNLMVWLLTACTVGYAVFRRPLRAWFSSGVGRAALWVLAVLAGIYLAVIAFVAVSGYTNPPTGNEQVVIVLGAGLHKDKPSRLLQYRLNKAYEFAAAHPDTLVITSGGQGRDEWVPEGDAMRDYLIAKGLPPERVVAESRSTSTEENFAFSLAIMREYGFDETTPVVYVSNAFHCYRAGKYAAMAGLTDTTELPAATPWRSALPCYLREALALLYYWVFKTSATGPMHAMVGLLDMNKNFFYK